MMLNVYRPPKLGLHQKNYGDRDADVGMRQMTRDVDSDTKDHRHMVEKQLSLEKTKHARPRE